MKQLLSGTTLAAALLLAPQLGLAQTAPQTGTAAAQAGAIPPQAMQQLQQAEQSLSQALRQMNAAPEAQQGQAAQGVRQALTQLQQAMGQVPADRRGTEGYRNLERRVGEAQAALQGDRPDVARARTAVDAVVVAIPVLIAQVGGPAGGATGAQIVLRQAADQIQVQQASPQVTVQQAQPEVLVVVPQPEIIVRQPPPQVTVRMPQPEVAVQQAQPQVRVVETAPQVQVLPSQQPAQVQVNPAEPRVVVQQQGQPQIRYEQTGQAQVRVEQQGQQTAAVAGAAAAGAAAAGLPLQRVTNLIGTNVVGSGGRDAGEVENFLLDRSGNVRAAVVEWGGFLGIGERRAVVPIEQIQFGGPNERARLNMTREQLEQLGSFDRNNLGQYGTRYGWGDGLRLYR